MMENSDQFAGGCACSAVRYNLLEKPMFVNCCHCSWCQRESGSAFAVNALVETAKIAASGVLEVIITPSASGKGQKVVRCAACKVALWSHYAGAGPNIAMLKVGTLDVPALCPPQAHIYTSTRQPWVLLPPEVPVFIEYYDMSAMWSAEALARRAAAKALPVD